MQNFFKYLNAGKFDEEWGLYLNVAGKIEVLPNELYPNPKHPTGYFFSWGKGRILTEYQINYITEGSGVLETKEGEYVLKRGSLFIIKPGEWHRYRPDKQTGWTENYVGFNGIVVDEMFEKGLISSNKPVINIGEREEFIDTYIKIFDLINSEAPGYQQVAAGMIMKLLGYIVAFAKQKGYLGNRIEQIIKQACFTMRSNVSSSINLEQIATDNNVGYAYFRKMFKKYMGIPPLKYYNDLKVIKAKELLITSDKLVKEISDELGFQSIYYFSRLFKNKTGFTPSEFKAQNNILLK